MCRLKANMQSDHYSIYQYILVKHLITFNLHKSTDNETTATYEESNKLSVVTHNHKSVSETQVQRALTCGECCCQPEQRK